jgi:hypothetical protein
MTETEPNANVAPFLCRVNVRIQRFDNLTPDQNGYLIPPEQLAAVNRALDDCIAFIESRSIPTLRKNERLILNSAIAREKWLVDVRGDFGGKDPTDVARANYLWASVFSDLSFRRTFLALVSAWRELEGRWPALLPEAEKRFRRRFGSDLYEQYHLPAESIWMNFIAWGEYDGNASVNSHHLLGQFSVFEPPETLPETPDILEVLRTARKHEELNEQRRAGLIDEQEHLDRLRKLYES